MSWSETTIAKVLARQFFERKNLVLVPNCTWPGSECDLLVVNPDLRIIDVEIKISRADLKADAKKEKWWHSLSYAEATARGVEPWNSKEPATWPRKVWKHYYCMPAEIWDESLLGCLPSPASGVLLLKTQQYDGRLIVQCARRATPNKNCDRITPAGALDIARLASLRMWNAFDRIDELEKKVMASA